MIKRSSIRVWSMLLVSIICITPAYADSESGLGRLFTDPESRARLDAAREPVINQAGEDPATMVRVDGVMVREDGRNVVWVNGTSTLESDSLNGVRVHSRNADRKDFRVPVGVDGKTVRLKPGQVWSDETGRVKDDY